MIHTYDDECCCFDCCWTREHRTPGATIPSDEDIARLIAKYHGSRMVLRGDGITHTIASLKGYGQFGDASDKYANVHWQEYVNAARAVRQLLLPDQDEGDV